MKTSNIKLLSTVAFLFSICIASSPALAESVTLTSGDILEIRFDVPVLPNSTSDMFFIFTNASTVTGNFDAITEIFDGDTLLGTYTDGYSQITSRWITADSLSEIGNPEIIDFTSLLNGSIDGLTRTTITGIHSITFDTEAIKGKFGTAIDSNSWYSWPVEARILSVMIIPEVKPNTPPVADAGDNQWMVGLSSVTLDGTQSSDPENDDITYMWTLQTPEESSAVLDDATSATPSFTADIYGYYYAALEVIDSNGMTSENNSHVAVSFYPPNQFSKLDSSFGSETITVDNQTDNKWLDLNLTTNRSYDEIVAEMLPGGEFEGFRHATTDEALELFSNADFELTHGWARWNHNAFNYLVQYIGISFEIPGFPTMSGWTGDTTGTPPNVLVESVVAYKEDRPGNVTYQMGVAYDISPGFPSDFISESSGHWLIAGDGYTLPGINVEVSDEETGTTILFDVVNSGGNTTVTTTPQGQGPPPPTGLKLVPLGTYYEIHTTAEYAGIIQIAIKYDDTGLTTGQENALKLRCYEEATDEWENITTGLDTVKNIIYAETSHLSFFAITMPRLVEIDIKPGSYPNSINSNNGGVIPVAILTTDTFDASSVIPETVALEGTGVSEKGRSGRYGSMEDVDGDGDLDLIVQVVNDIYWAENATEATLTGMTWDGILIEGTDSINIVPPE